MYLGSVHTNDTEFREIYHGDQWLTDERFFTPMVTTTIGDVFVGDFVVCIIEQCRVLYRFYSKVSFYYWVIGSHTLCIFISIQDRSADIYVDVTPLQNKKEGGF